MKIAIIKASELGDDWRAEAHVEPNEDDADAAIIAAAREMYEDDDISIDHSPELSHGEDWTWVAAWVFVPKDEDDADLEEAAEGEICNACQRPSIDCSRNPCPSVINERSEGEDN